MKIALLIIFLTPTGVIETVRIAEFASVSRCETAIESLFAMNPVNGWMIEAAAFCNAPDPVGSSRRETL